MIFVSQQYINYKQTNYFFLCLLIWRSSLWSNASDRSHMQFVKVSLLLLLLLLIAWWNKWWCQKFYNTWFHTILKRIGYTKAQDTTAKQPQLKLEQQIKLIYDGSFGASLVTIKLMVFDLLRLLRITSGTMSSQPRIFLRISEASFLYSLNTFHLYKSYTSEKLNIVIRTLSSKLTQI